MKRADLATFYRIMATTHAPTRDYLRRMFIAHRAWHAETMQH